MPPKRAPSGGPARGSSRGPHGKAKAKAAPAEPAAGAAPSAATAAAPPSELEKEAEELFERRQADGDKGGVLKLAEFAEVIRGMNSRKCMIWGDDPAHVIKEEWTKVGGNVTREVTLAQFKVWYPAFVDAVNAEIAEKEAKAQAKAEEARKAREAKYSGDGIWRIAVKDIPEAMLEASKKGKTPLIIDNTEGHVAETYFVYSNAHIIECKKMIVEKAQGASVEDLLEEERRRLFSAKCFQHGKTVVFRLANTACDLNKTFNSEVFPSLALLDATEVAKVKGSEQAANVKGSPFHKMAPDADEASVLEYSGIHSDFSVVAITHFKEEDYEGFLKDMVPLHLMQPMMPTQD